MITLEPNADPRLNAVSNAVPNAVPNADHELNVEEIRSSHLVLTAAPGDLLDQLLQEEPILTPEEEGQAALAEMERDATAHLTSPVLRCLAEGKDMERLASIVLPHLTECSWCRSTLREALRLCDIPETHPAHAILEESREWDRWNAAGATAAETTCSALIEQGIGYVYGRDGEAYRRLPSRREDRIRGEEQLIGTEALRMEAEPAAR